MFYMYSVCVIIFANKDDDDEYYYYYYKKHTHTYIYIYIYKYIKQRKDYKSTGKFVPKVRRRDDFKNPTLHQ